MDMLSRLRLVPGWSLHMDHHWGIPAVFIALETLGTTQPSLLLPLPATASSAYGAGGRRGCGHMWGPVLAGLAVAALLRCS